MRQLGDLALGEKGITQRLRLVRSDLHIKQLAFERAAFVERQGRGRLDRLDAGIGRALVAGAPRDCFAGGLEQLRRALGEFFAPVADAGQGADIADPAGEGNRRGAQICFGDELVNDAERVCLLGRDVAARRDHLERRLRTDQARQALGPAGTRQDADLHLGEAQFGARHRDPVMAGKRDFQAAAQGIAVDRGDHRLRALVEHIVGPPPARGS